MFGASFKIQDFRRACRGGAAWHCREGHVSQWLLSFLRSIERQGFDLAAFRQVPSSLLVPTHASVFRIYSCIVCLACPPTQPAHCQDTVRNCAYLKEQEQPRQAEGALRAHTEWQEAKVFVSFFLVSGPQLSVCIHAVSHSQMYLSCSLHFVAHSAQPHGGGSCLLQVRIWVGVEAFRWPCL